MAGVFSKLLLGLLLFSFIILGTTTYYSDLATRSGSSVNTSDLTRFDVSTRVLDLTNNTVKGIRDSQLTGTPLDLPIVLVVGVYNVLKLIMDSVIDIFGVLVDAVVISLSLPEWAKTLIYGSMIIVIIMGLISVVLRYEV